MRSGFVTAAYIPGESPLHHLHAAAKAALLVVYVVTIAARPEPVGLLALLILLVATAVAMRLPVRYAWLHFIVGALLAAQAFVLPSGGIGGQLILGLGRIACLMLLIALFGMTTRANDLLPVGASGWRGSAAFAVSLTVAMLPGIQYDLQRAVDSETLRRGRPVGPLDLGVWLGLLPRTILRGLARADRLAEAVADRGFALGRPFTSLTAAPFGPKDAFWSVIAALPALLLWVGLP